MTCALCELPVDHRELVEKAPIFCCKGCESVYQILEAKNELDRKFTHPVFQQALSYGLISNSKLLKKDHLASIEKKRWVFEVGHMWCPACAQLIILVLETQKGIVHCHVDYITDLASIEYDPQLTYKDDIQKKIEDLGYSLKELCEQKPLEKTLLFRFAIASFSAFNVMMFAYPLYATFFDMDFEELQPVLAGASLLLTLPAVFYAGWPLYRRMILQFRVGYLGMEALIGASTTAAFILSCWEMVRGTYHIYFDVVCVLIAFLLLGKIIEAKAKFSSKNALLRIHHALPRKARKLKADGSSEFIPLKEIKLGDHLLAMTGEKIVLDGVVISGDGIVDESFLTGEGRPISKEKNDRLLSSSLLLSGRIAYKATSTSENSTLARIIHLVEQSLGEKSFYVDSIDQFVKWFTPAIFAFALLIFLTFLFLGNGEEGIRRTLAILLIACPCAIGIAAPFVESRLLQSFSNQGALVRNRALFYKFPFVTHFVFDKTGTVTEGLFKVLGGLETLNEQELSILKGLSSQSLHPISQAIFKAIDGQEAFFETIREVLGKGVEGKIGEKQFSLGSRRFAIEKGFTLSFASQDVTEAFFMSEKKILASMTLGDSIRSEAVALLKGLKQVKKILLSGDHFMAVEKIGKNLGFDAFIAESTPLEKKMYIEKLKEEGAVIAMIGDGINDAPALAKADVGISVVAASEISIQSSDLLLTSDQLSILLELKDKALKGCKVIKQNLFWAFIYNGVGIALASFGLLNPLFASFAMVISSLFVLLNARRV